ncbi:MAG: methylmalonyl Co-A mutase-associated GTPase MeaB [candidate division WOR-3 bacterium]|nr:methylmalonyl Co-A mutase-associated GTPase MeaB [candidate division WOR-3 bacterium]
MDLIKNLLKGDKLSIARVISQVEDDTGYDILDRIYPYTGNAYHIGITGPPGAGKSTLVNAIAKKLLRESYKIGIIAVDPTSPFSGGALLGDRIRMGDLSLQKNVFIRSMATRGSLGGLSKKTKDVALVLDAAGMDYILIETVGVGQVELDIAQVCDTKIVVLVPESGDSIQAMKAGLLEIADIVVVNKGDREGSDSLLIELKFAFDLKPKTGWRVPILKTIATDDSGIDELVKEIGNHKEYLEKSDEIKKLQKMRILNQIHEYIETEIKRHLRETVIDDKELDRYIEKIMERKVSPYKIARKIMENMLKGG